MKVFVRHLRSRKSNDLGVICYKPIGKKIKQGWVGLLLREVARGANDNNFKLIEAKIQFIVAD